VKAGRLTVGELAIVLNLRYMSNETVRATLRTLDDEGEHVDVRSRQGLGVVPT